MSSGDEKKTEFNKDIEEFGSGWNKNTGGKSRSGIKKLHSKSLRISDEVLKFVMEYPEGIGFTGKIVNLLLEFKNSIPEREKKIEILDNLLKKKEEMLSEIGKIIPILARFSYDIIQLIDGYKSIKNK